MITYRQLLEQLESFSEEQLDQYIVLWDKYENDFFEESVEVMVDDLSPNQIFIRF